MADRNRNILNTSTSSSTQRRYNWPRDYSSNYLNRPGRNSQTNCLKNNQVDLIPKEYIDKIFKAIEDLDILTLFQIYNSIKQLKLSQTVIRDWLITTCKKYNQTCLINACCTGNLNIVKFIVETIFIGHNQTTTVQKSNSKNSSSKREENSLNTLQVNSTSFSNIDKSYKNLSHKNAKNYVKSRSVDLISLSSNINDLTAQLETLHAGPSSTTVAGSGTTSKTDTNARSSEEPKCEVIDELLNEEFTQDSQTYINFRISPPVSNSNLPETTSLPISRKSSFDSIEDFLLRNPDPDNTKRTSKEIHKLDLFLEIKGTIKCDEDSIDGATALWTASSFGYVEICKYLIDKGACIHSRTNAGSTPLRCACYDGHLETVKLLVSKGADVEASNKHGHTCLMIACYRGQLKVVEYLLAMGVDVNKRGNRGSTALHDTSEKGCLEIFKVLLTFGGDLEIKDNQGQTALISAAISGSANVIDYVAESMKYTNIKNLVNAKELLGCWYIEKERNARRGLKLWREALSLRMKHNCPKENNGRNAIGTTINAIKSMIDLFGWSLQNDCPVDAVFPNLNEFNTLSDLVNLFQDVNEVRTQSQIVRFRILGPDHHECSMYMRTRGALFADQGDWHKCSKIWLVTMLLHSKYRDPICGATIQHFIASIQLFQHMLASSIVTPGINNLDYRDVICTIEGAFYECQRWYKSNAYCTDDIDSPEDRANKILRYSLILTNFALLCLQPKIKPIVKNTDNESLILRLKNVIAAQSNLKSPDGPSILHMAASEHIKFTRRRLDGIQRDDTEIEDELFSINHLDPNTSTLFKKWLRLPSVELVEFLIKNGHNVTILDKEFNTPLHIACKQRASSNLIAMLAKSAPSINAFQENKWGKTAYEYLKRAMVLKEINTKHFFDDGPGQIDNVTGQSIPRNTRSLVLNRYSLGRAQIANQATLEFLLSMRSLKSIAASAISVYLKTDEIKHDKLEYVTNLDYYLSKNLMEYLQMHCYEVKELSNQLSYHNDKTEKNATKTFDLKTIISQKYTKRSFTDIPHKKLSNEEEFC